MKAQEQRLVGDAKVEVKSLRVRKVGQGRVRVQGLQPLMR